MCDFLLINKSSWCLESNVMVTVHLVCRPKSVEQVARKVAFQDLQYFLCIFWHKSFYYITPLNGFAIRGILIKVHIINL